MKLVEDYKKAWKWFSVHALLLVGILPTVWIELPADLKATLPPGAMSTIAIVIALCGIIGRLVDQDKKQ